MSSYSRLPVDFEERARRPRQPNGLGSPGQISAKDLMANFRYLEDNTPEPSTVTLDEITLTVIDNGVFKTGSFYINGALTPV